MSNLVKVVHRGYCDETAVYLLLYNLKTSVTLLIRIPNNS